LPGADHDGADSDCDLYPGRCGGWQQLDGNHLRCNY
jgi:hypothetical protein